MVFLFCEVCFLNNNYNDNFMNDIVVIDEDLVDINIGGNYQNNNNNNRYNKNGKKKKIIIISSVAVAVAAAVAIAGFCLLGPGGSSAVNKNEFVFTEGTEVSGISISGQTMEDAKSTLTAYKKNFIKPIDLDVDVAGEIFKLSEENFDYTYDIDSVLTNIKSDQTATSQHGSDDTKSYAVTATVTDESIEDNIKEIAENTDKDFVNARVSKFTPYGGKNRFEYKEAEAGCKLNTQDLSEQIKKAVDSGVNSVTITADVKTTKADINIDDLKENIVKLASYETTSYNTANGTENMRVSLAACNGSVIEPGKTWSFNDCTGNSNLESNGYKPASVIENGKLTDGIGGGICQSSSTIYNAAVRANLDVEERYNHKWASSYVPTGLDATIDYGNLDLKLSNPTDYQMFLECKLVDSNLYVSFWGYKSPDYDEIKTHNEMTDKNKNSYTVKAWRVYFKDGKEVGRESLGSSTYDSDHGYIFIEADNDSGSTDRNVDNLQETSTSKPESSSKPDSSSKHESDNSNSSSQVNPPQPKPTHPKPTEPKPTQAPTEKPTESSETEPATSADDAE